MEDLLGGKARRQRQLDGDGLAVQHIVGDGNRRIRCSAIDLNSCSRLCGKCNRRNSCSFCILLNITHGNIHRNLNFDQFTCINCRCVYTGLLNNCVLAARNCLGHAVNISLGLNGSLIFIGQIFISGHSDSSLVIHNHFCLGRSSATDHVAVAGLIRCNNKLAFSLVCTRVGGEITAGDKSGLILTVNSIRTAIDSLELAALYSDIDLSKVSCGVVLRVALIECSITGNRAAVDGDFNRQLGCVLCNCNACTNRSRTITIRCYTGRNSIAIYSCAIYCQLTCTNFNTCLAATNTATINSSSCITSQIHALAFRSNRSRIQIDYRCIRSIFNITININARTQIASAIFLTI